MSDIKNHIEINNPNSRLNPRRTASLYLLSFFIINYVFRLIELSLLYPLTLIVFIIGFIDVCLRYDNNLILPERAIFSILFHLIPIFMYKSNNITTKSILLSIIILLLILFVYINNDQWPYILSLNHMFFVIIAILFYLRLSPKGRIE